MEMKKCRNVLWLASTQVLVLISVTLFFLLCTQRVYEPFAFRHSVLSGSLQNTTFSTPYHNTLLTNIISVTDLFNGSDHQVEQETNLDSLRRRLIAAEKLYKSKVKQRHEQLAYPNILNPWNKESRTHIWHYFPPAFNCPHTLQRVGRLGEGGKWICGLDLYESSPKAEECVVYAFGNVSVDNSVEKEVISRTKCSVFKFDSRIGSESLTTQGDSRLMTFSNVKLSERNLVTSQEKTLRSVMTENDHGWLDMLLINIEGRELPALEQIMEDYADVLPFGQLQVEIHVPLEARASVMFYKFFKWFERLERKGLRPFAREANLDECIFGNGRPTVMEYAFINLRGKHLLLTGK